MIPNWKSFTTRRVKEEIKNLKKEFKKINPTGTNEEFHKFLFDCAFNNGYDVGIAEMRIIF